MDEWFSFHKRLCDYFIIYNIDIFPGLSWRQKKLKNNNNKKKTTTTNNGYTRSKCLLPQHEPRKLRKWPSWGWGPLHVPQDDSEQTQPIRSERQWRRNWNKQSIVRDSEEETETNNKVRKLTRTPKELITSLSKINKSSKQTDSKKWNKESNRVFLL